MTRYITSKDIKSTIATLNKTNDKIKNYKDRAINEVQLEKFKLTILVQLYKMYKYIMDLNIYGSQTVYIRMNHNNVNEYIKRLKDEVPTKELLENIIDEFLCDYYNYTADIENVQDYQLNTLFDARNENSFHEEQDEDYEEIIKIINAINIPNRDIKYINPQCFDKKINEYYKEYIDKLQMFAVMPNSFRDNIISEQYEKCIFDDDSNIYNPLASGRNIKISNNVFDIMHLKPKISAIPQKKNNLYSCQPYEQYALTDNFRLLRKHGILVYTIPYCRLSNEIIMFLAKNLRNISIIKRQGNRQNLITVIGYKSQVLNYSDEYNRIKFMLYNEIPIDIEYEYELPNKAEEVEIFRGGKISEKDVDNIILNDDLYNDFYLKRNSSEEKYDDKPLLPFNIGQIGLILTSGKLDGVIEEPGDIKHIIKGRTIKYTENINSDNANVSRVQKVSNKVQINALDANGNFIVIS